MAFKSWNPEMLSPLKVKPKVSVDLIGRFTQQALLNSDKVYKYKLRFSPDCVLCKVPIETILNRRARHERRRVHSKSALARRSSFIAL